MSGDEQNNELMRADLGRDEGTLYLTKDQLVRLSIILDAYQSADDTPDPFETRIRQLVKEAALSQKPALDVEKLKDKLYDHFAQKYPDTIILKLDSDTVMEETVNYLLSTGHLRGKAG